MSFRSSAVYASNIKLANKKSIALVTGGKTGIGKAIAEKIAAFPHIEQVISVSRSITSDDVKGGSPKIQAFAADVSVVEDRQKIVDRIKKLSSEGHQLRYLIHNAGIIDPVKPVLEVTAEELRHGMSVNCESPLLLTTALYPYMVPPTTPQSDATAAGRVLHVSSGAAHGAPPVGWSVYGITKAAFFQSFLALGREFQELGGKVVVGSFKPGIVDTPMQGTIRESSASDMPLVGYFQSLKEKIEAVPDETRSRPPPSDCLDTPSNVAHFAEFLLVGTTDEEFSKQDEWDIRNPEIYQKWIAQEDLLS